MSRVARSILALCFAAAAGCSTSAEPLVDYRLSGGFSGVSAAAVLQVTTDGTATKTSTLHGTTTTTVQLDAATLDDLNRKIADAQFPTLPPRYGCGGCADQLVFVIGAQLDQRRYEVAIDDDNSVTYPDSLHALLTTLQLLAQP